MRIIGITGTLGAGKGTIVDYLMEQHGFQHYSVRGYLTRIIEERGLLLNRDSMVAVANDLRAQHGPSYIVEQLYEEAYKAGKDCIIESIRTPGEVEALIDKGDFYLFAVDADPKVRYERVTERKSATDSVGFDEFVANEQREMTNTDPNKQNLSACIEMADYKFENNGTFAELHKQVEETLNAIEQQHSH